MMRIVDKTDDDDNKRYEMKIKRKKRKKKHNNNTSRNLTNESITQNQENVNHYDKYKAKMNASQIEM